MWLTCVYPVLISGNVIDVLIVVIVLMVVIAVTVSMVWRLFHGHMLTASTNVESSKISVNILSNVDHLT